jgi:D-alanine-D-alanine ligase
MKKISKHIEIVRSTAAGLSSMGVKTAQAIQEILAATYTSVHISIINDLYDLELLAARQPDLVFMGMKFIPTDPMLGIHDPRKIWISQYLDARGITSTGSEGAAYEFEFDKAQAKLQVQMAGLQTSPFYVIPAALTDYPENFTLDYPVFIKPTNLGGGKGIDNNSIAHDFDALRSKVSTLAQNLQADALIEQYLSGREFSVAILKHEFLNGFMAMPLELIAPENSRGERLLSAEIKSNDRETFIAVTDPEIRQKISSLALQVFDTLGARDFGRIDIRLDDAGVPHFLEANLIPSLMKGYGNFPKACALDSDMEYEDMIHHIVRLGLTRTGLAAKKSTERTAPNKAYFVRFVEWR